MKQEVLETQHDLDPTTPAIAVDLNEFPFAAKDEYTKYMVLSKGKEICIKEWYSLPATGYEVYHGQRKGEIIPIADMIAELETILSEMKKSL